MVIAAIIQQQQQPLSDCQCDTINNFPYKEYTGLQNWDTVRLGLISLCHWLHIICSCKRIMRNVCNMFLMPFHLDNPKWPTSPADVHVKSLFSYIVKHCTWHGVWPKAEVRLKATCWQPATMRCTGWRSAAGIERLTGRQIYVLTLKQRDTRLQ